MSTFLDDKKLGPAIIDLMTAPELRCAVAFWGSDAVSKLFGGGAPPQGLRVICEVTMGGTNPAELVRLNAPNNEMLKHIPGLHAKVYISEQAVIIGSANASDNGIGFSNQAKLFEAGTLHRSGTDVYGAAVRWFEAIWKNAPIIDKEALASAEAAWARRSKEEGMRKGRGPIDPNSLLDADFHSPMRFKSVGFAFTETNSTTQQRDKAAAEVVSKDKGNPTSLLSKADKKGLKLWPVSDTYAEWNLDDINSWPFRFVCAHRGERSKRLSYWFYERAHTVALDGRLGTLLARRSPSLKLSLGWSVGRKKMADTDNKSVSHVFDYIEKSGRQLFVNGDELAKVLGTLPPWRSPSPRRRP